MHPTRAIRDGRSKPRQSSSSEPWTSPTRECSTRYRGIYSLSRLDSLEVARITAVV